MLIKKAYKALPEKGTLVVVENIIDNDRSKNAFGLMMSLNMLIETDSPFLTPMPFRGKRNEPKNVRFPAQRIADLKGLSLEDVARITFSKVHEEFLFTGENLFVCESG